MLLHTLSYENLSGLQSNSVWGQRKSLGFLHLLIPNPFIPLLPHTALGIKQIEKG